MMDDSPGSFFGGLTPGGPMNVPGGGIAGGPGLDGLGVDGRGLCVGLGPTGFVGGFGFGFLFGHLSQ